MKVAILESIVMPAGHEVEFDRILTDGLKTAGHDPLFFVPEKFPFKLDYHVPVTYLDGGEAITYAGAGKIKRLFLSIIREKRRIAWFNSAYDKAVRGECDAIIIPTASFRFIKSLRNSKLLNSPIPVYLIFHGIIPKEQNRFEKEAKTVENYSNIHLKIIALRDDFKGHGLTNISLIIPPVYTPKENINYENLSFHTPLRIGFFGQFRKEKGIEIFLDAFKKADFKTPVEFVVQGATVKPEDKKLFTDIINTYSNIPGLSFVHKNLIGKEWEDALLGVDAILMPYGADRYRYQSSAMLFTAIGFYKPVLVSPELNPEILENYKIGNIIFMDSVDGIARQLEGFVNDLITQQTEYQVALTEANKAYGQETFIKQLLNMI